MVNVMIEEIEACPFCGSKDISLVFRTRSAELGCKNCNVFMRIEYDFCHSIEEAKAKHQNTLILKWNRRYLHGNNS